MNLDERTILDRLTKAAKPLSFDEFCQWMEVAKKERKRFRKAIKYLQLQGKITQTTDHRYRLLTSDDTIIGTLTKHPDGFGFLEPENPSQEDIYLNYLQAASYIEGDKLKILKIEEKEKNRGTKRYRGHVLELLERGPQKIVGKIFVQGKTAFLVPQKKGSYFGAADNVSIPYAPELQKLRHKIVLVGIRKYPSRERHAEGKLIEVLGEVGDKAVDFSLMIHAYDLRHEFSKGVLAEAEDIKSWSLENAICLRTDLRQNFFVTIDGETAKDFDDAVSILKLPNGNFKLWVAIADVSFFVREDSKLDQEAFERSTSIYFPGGVIPMFPEILSNDLCSLNPHEDKMTFCCEMEFNANGKRVDFKIYEAVIQSRQRLTYTLVQHVLDKKQVTPVSSELEAFIFIMEELKEILKNSRKKRGCLNFDLPEPEIILNIQGGIESIVKRERLASHMIIEEFMIAANETVAEFMFDRHRPFIYRVHDEPDADVLFEFHRLAHNVGYVLKHQKEPHPKIYSDLLEKIKNSPAEYVLNTALLRSMKHAMYSAHHRGHFGLASTCYTHFTSPIRRYPDLMVHRLLKKELKKKTDHTPGEDDRVGTLLERKAIHCSRQERIAEEAEREFLALKKAQFMLDKIGLIFSGYISGMMNFGFFVKLSDYFIEGLVPFSSIEDDYYEFIPERYLIRGRQTKKLFQLGDRVNIKVVSVDLDQRQIDFQWVA